jgi:hypothetical protein
MFDNQEEIMKYIKQSCLALIICVAAATVQAAPVIEKPAVMPEAMLSVTIPDLQGLIDGIGGVVAKASPMMNSMMLKQMIGMQLGDPGLAGIAPGKGLSIVALDPTNVFAVVEVAEAQSAAYANMATSQGMKAAYTNGVLILFSAPEVAAKAIAMAGSVQSSLLAKRSPTLRIAAQPAAIVERNNDQIQGFLQMMPAMMGAGMMQAPGADTNAAISTVKILEGELRVLVSIAKQCAVGELVVAPENGSIRITETFVPKAGTRLASLVEATKQIKPNARIQSGMLHDGGLMRVDFSMASPQAVADFFMAETKSLVEEMAIKDVDVAGLSETMAKWMNLYAGTGCETFDFDAEKGMNVSYLLETGDEAAVLALLRSMEKDMAPFLKLYENMGISMAFKFKENSGEYKGIKLHRLEMDMDMATLTGEMRQQMEAMKMDDMAYDIALFDGLMLYTMGEGTLQSAIDRIKDPATSFKPVVARSVYPEGGFYYFDFDIGRYVEMIAAFVPQGEQNPISPQIVAMLQGVDPLTSAGFRQDGRMMWSVNIPGDLIGKLGQIGMMMQMQKMQQQQQMGAPQGMPGGMPPAGMPVQ